MFHENRHKFSAGKNGDEKRKENFKHFDRFSDEKSTNGRSNRFTRALMPWMAWGGEFSGRFPTAASHGYNRVTYMMCCCPAATYELHVISHLVIPYAG